MSMVRFLSYHIIVYAFSLSPGPGYHFLSMQFQKRDIVQRICIVCGGRAAGAAGAAGQPGSRAAGQPGSRAAGQLGSQAAFVHSQMSVVLGSAARDGMS